MKAIRCALLATLVVGGAACGSSSGSSASTEKYCAVAKTLDTKMNAVSGLFNSDGATIKAGLADAKQALADALAVAPKEVKADLQATADGVDQFDALFAKADYNLLDVDQGELSKVGPAVSAAGDKVQAYNEKQCGIPITTTTADGSGSGDSSETTAAISGTGRDLIVSNLVGIGLTDTEANCVADNLDPSLAAEVGSDPSKLVPIFEKCGIDAARLAEIGATATTAG